MRRNKIGSIFLVSVLALAGIGISYAGFFDTIHVYGEVDTASVEIDILEGWYSGTWVYKIWFPIDIVPPNEAPGNPFLYEPGNEILIYKGFTNEVPPEDDILDWASTRGFNAELEAYSYAKDGETHDGEQYDIDFVYSDIFPCIDFKANFVVHYIGSIPARVNPNIIIDTYYPEGGSSWLDDLYNDYDYASDRFGIGINVYKVDPIEDTSTGDITGWDNYQLINPLGYQVHYCDYFLVEVIIHLPQLNIFNDKYAEFSADFSVTQWYDPGCAAPGTTE